MTHWQCNCGTVRPIENPGPCEACGFVAPPVEPAAPAMPADEAGRLLGLAEWLDAQVAARPAIAVSPVGAGLSLLIDAAKRDPSATWRQLTDGAAALDGIIRWVRDAVPPDPAYIERLIGPLTASNGAS